MVGDERTGRRHMLAEHVDHDGGLEQLRLFERPAGDASARSTCADDIEDWDSLEQINLLTAIEKKFNIKFKLADVRGLKDVGDLLDLVARMV